MAKRIEAMRLIDVDKLISSLGWLVESGMTGNKTKAVLKLAIQTADGQPTVDAVEVVRCKDCYYCVTEKSFGKVYHYCEAFEQYAEGDLIGVSLQVSPDHFCSWGERREENGAEN